VFIRLWREMAKRDLPVEVFPDYFPCGLRVDWASLIDPGGVLYTCAGLLGNPEYAKGTVGSTSVSQKHIELLEDEIPGPCLQCRWVPVCGGGCRYVATVLGVDRLCEKAFYERAYPEYVRIRAEQALATLEGQPPASGCL